MLKYKCAPAERSWNVGYNGRFAKQKFKYF